ncbi:Lrp/AsnC family transcriptional regulator [Fusibacter sp. JL216-2]|uniref:Lrp/AsnC family transcriptional regulator n=1 Tax=Fusibacter sp. JL216-2 TaxID=3071453 RepID=UPI003D325C44
MDSTDYKILKILKENGRMSHEEIAKQVNLSRPAVRARIVALEAKGIILGYSTCIDYDALGYNIQVFVYIKVSKMNYDEIKAGIIDVASEKVVIDELYRISGEWCLLLKVMCHSQNDITEFVDEILRIDCVVATNTVFIFKS